MINTNLNNNNKHSTFSDNIQSTVAHSNNNKMADIYNSLSKNSGPPSLFGSILFAEAGKKKKKEKSEVVVISVNNPSKGHGGMYPMFVPTCSGGHGGYGRRKRSITPLLY